MSLHYDLILDGGRVIDAHSNIDENFSIGIKSGRIERVSSDLNVCDASESIDLSGQWVIPGHIDTHAHVSGISTVVDYAIGHKMLAKSGTTTVLDMAGTPSSLIDGIHRKGAGLNVAGLHVLIPGVTTHGSEMSSGVINTFVSDSLRAGCIGIKILGGHYPMTPAITRNIIKSANEQMAYIAYHVGTKETGSNVFGVREIPDLLGTGRLHVCHMNSYCRGSVYSPEKECQLSIEVLKNLGPQVVSEVYHAVANGTGGACDRNGEVVSNVTSNSLIARGYEPTISGMESAFIDRYVSVLVAKEDEMVHITGPDGLREYRNLSTVCGVSFPVNVKSSSETLTSARFANEEFVVDAISTDGGVHPRNVAIESAMGMVRSGKLTPIEMVKKLCWNPSLMLGLENKGHISKGADADITVVDPRTGIASMAFVMGQMIMKDGEVIGKSGRLLTTLAGETSAYNSGLEYQIINMKKTRLYENF